MAQGGGAQRRAGALAVVERVLALLAVVALVACGLPARAATRVDPVQALRQD